MNSILRTRLLPVALIVAGCWVPAATQETRGTILGNVTDSSGAVVPAAQVTITNLDTNTVTRVTTNAAGLYEAPLLLPGSYEIAAEASGFRKLVRRGIVLNVGARLEINLPLQVGQVVDQVTVTAESPLLETTSASSGQTFDNRYVSELPVLGNSVMLMAGLAAGMQRTGGYNYLGLHSTVGASDYKTSGGVGGNEWTLDGTPNTGHSRRAAYLPYTDAVAEFRVESTTFDAGVGHTTGAVVSMQSKAGTNTYHGTLTESHWQQRWNATPSNDNAAYWQRVWNARNAGNSALAEQILREPKQPSGRSNNYAASIGGSVRIPKIYNGRDKLFFYFIFNGFKDAKTEEPGNKLHTVPTAEERRGDFSSKLRVNAARYQLYDPLTTRLDAATGLYTRNPFPNNIIPQARHLNPMYRFYERLYPLPNNPPQADAEGRNNYFNGSIPFNWDYKAFQNRVDFVKSDRHRFFGRWSYNKFVEDRADWTMETHRYLHSNALHRINKNVGVDWVYTLNARTILNVAAAYNRYFDAGLPTERLKFKPSDVGLPAYIDAKAGDLHLLPRLDFSDGSYRDVSGGYPVLNVMPAVGTLKADFMKYIGKHSVKAGWDGRMYYRSIGSPGNTSGNFEWRNNLLRRTNTQSGVGTFGPEWAAFLLGIPNAMSIDTNDNGYITTPYQAIFVQDTWRLTAKLTLTLGGRMEYEGSIKERFDRGLRDFDFDYVPPIAAAAQAAYAANPLPERPASDFIVKGGVRYLGLNAPRTRTDPTYRVMPRLGFAYAVSQKMVVRGGYGIYYDTLNVSHTTIDQSGYSRGTGTQMTNDNGVTWNYGYFTRNNPPVTDPFPVREDGTRFNVPFGNRLGADAYLGRGFTFLNPSYEPAEQHRWRIEIERQLLGNSVFAIAYAGAYVPNLSALSDQVNLRPLPERYWASGLARNQAIADDLGRQVPNPFYNLHLQFAASNPLLYQQLSTVGRFTSRMISKDALLRPYPHMSGLEVNNLPIGKNKYNALQVRYEKRFSAGWSVNTHYEWSHTMSKDWLANEFAPPLWRESDNSRPHRWVAQGIYELPFGKGKRLLNRSGALNAFLGGWQLGSILQVQSGEAIDFGNLFYYGDNYRDLVLPADQRSKDRWFDNTRIDQSYARSQGIADNSCAVPAGFRGFEGRSYCTPAGFHRRVFPNRMNWLRTSGLVQWDANVQKTVPITESLKAQFRVDLLNAPNHQVLGGPNTDPTSSSFGIINNFINTPRYIQFQLRLSF